MAGKKRALSPTQMVALQRVADARSNYVASREAIREQVRLEIEERMRGEERKYAEAIRAARTLGVAKAAIGRSMGTSDPGTVNRWLKKTEQGKAFTSIELVDTDTVHVQFRNYPTTAISASDYPEVLEGVAKVDRTKPSGWAVVKDPGDKTDQFGTLPGWFTWEIETAEPGADMHLPTLLTAWLAENQ